MIHEDNPVWEEKLKAEVEKTKRSDYVIEIIMTLAIVGFLSFTFGYHIGYDEYAKELKDV